MNELLCELVGNDRTSLDKKKRVERAKKDFGFFCQYYLADYFFTDPAEYQSILYDVADNSVDSHHLSAGSKSKTL